MTIVLRKLLRRGHRRLHLDIRSIRLGKMKGMFTCVVVYCDVFVISNVNSVYRQIGRFAGTFTDARRSACQQGQSDIGRPLCSHSTRVQHSPKLGPTHL